MKIAVFGGCRASKSKSDWTPGPEDDFKRASHELGSEIARREHTILVGGSGEWSADRQVANGFLEVAGSETNTRASIQVMRPGGLDSAYQVENRRSPRLFRLSERRDGWWEGAHLASIQEADAVLTIGGGKSTYIAGLTSLVAGKTLIPIGCFGGSSKELLKTLEEKDANKPILEKLRCLNGQWTNTARDMALELIGVATRPSIFLIHGRSSDWEDLKDWLTSEGGVPTVHVMSKAFGGGSTLVEKFERLACSVDGAIALATPDDLGRLASKNSLAKRARQNVWLELGWVWGRIGRNRLMVLTKSNVQIPSDLAGLEVYYYKKKPRELATPLREFIDKLRWP